MRRHTFALFLVAIAVPASAATASKDDDQVFTVGEIEIPPGEPGQLSVVLAGRLNDSGHLPIVVRNNRDHTVYDIDVVVRGTDASGAEIAVAEYFISTAGVAPGEWTFGQNGVAVADLSEATDLQLQLAGSAEPGDLVGLEVTAAEIRDDAIVGTVMNDSDVVLGDVNVVNVVCFDGPQITDYQLAMAEPLLLSLGPGESARFATSIPIDATTCTAFAVYAVGLPAS